MYLYLFPNCCQIEIRIWFTDATILNHLEDKQLQSASLPLPWSLQWWESHLNWEGYSQFFRHWCTAGHVQPCKVIIYLNYSLLIYWQTSWAKLALLRKLKSCLDPSGTGKVFLVPSGNTSSVAVHIGADSFIVPFVPMMTASLGRLTLLCVTRVAVLPPE